MPELNNKIRAEDLLIRYLLKADLSSLAVEAKIKDSLNSALNWDYFLRQARGESISALLYQKLKAAALIRENLPEGIWQALAADYHETLCHNFSTSLQLKQLAGAFQGEHVRFLLFKGLALGESLYCNIGARRSTDMDILIKRADLADADRLLRGLGYSAPFDVSRFKVTGANAYRNSILYSSNNGRKIPVHLYWHLLNLIAATGQDIDMDKIWNEAVTFEFQGQSISTFSLLHQLLYLSLHILNHGFSPLMLICDINELINKHSCELNWKKLITEAHGFGLSKHLFYALYLSSEILGTAVPKEVLDELRPKKVSFFERKFMRCVLENRGTAWKEWLLFFGMHDGLRARVFYVRKALFPSKAEFGLIRQKNPQQITSMDYLSRLGLGLQCAFKGIFG